MPSLAFKGQCSYHFESIAAIGTPRCARGFGKRAGLRSSVLHADDVHLRHLAVPVCSDVFERQAKVAALTGREWHTREWSVIKIGSIGRDHGHGNGLSLRYLAEIILED